MAWQGEVYFSKWIDSVKEATIDIPFILTLIGVFLSPYWFLHPEGVNIGVADIAIITGGFIYIYRNIPSFSIRYEKLLSSFFPTRMTAIGIFTFLLMASISVIHSPVPVEALLNLIQYIYIFLFVIPVIMNIFDSTERLFLANSALFLALNTLLVAASLKSIWVESLKMITLGFGNQNNLYWLIGCAGAFNLVKALRARVRAVQLSYLCLVALSALLIVGSLTLSAALLLAGATWMILLIKIQRDGSDVQYLLFILATVISSLIAIATTIVFWETIAYQGNVYERLRQYEIAIQTAAQTFPFGTGLESSPSVLAVMEGNHAGSVHNALLSYLLEIGLIGALGMAIVFVDWLRTVPIKSFSSSTSSINWSLVGVFAGYLLVLMVQNVPVQRFWWIVFALSWRAYSPIVR